MRNQITNRSKDELTAEEIRAEIQHNITVISRALRHIKLDQKRLFNTHKGIEEEKKRKKAAANKIEKFGIGDIVRVTSNHKNRNGSIVRIVGYRGSTQYKVISTSASKSEENASKEGFAVWKSNVVPVVQRFNARK